MLPRDLVNLLALYTPDVARYVRASRALWAVHGRNVHFWRAVVKSHPVNKAFLDAAGHLVARWPELAPSLPAVVARGVLWAAPLRSGELVVLDKDSCFRVGERAICWAEFGQIYTSPSTALLAVQGEHCLDVFRMPSGECVQSLELRDVLAAFMSDDALVVYGDDLQLRILGTHDWTTTAVWRAPSPLDRIAASPTRCAGLQWRPNLVLVWDHQGMPLFTLQRQSVCTVAFAGGHLLIAPETTNKARAWHATSGELVRTYTLPGNEIHGLWAAGPRHFAAAMGDHRPGVTMSVHIVDVDTGAVKSRLCDFDNFYSVTDARDDAVVYLVDDGEQVCLRVPTL